MSSSSNRWSRRASLVAVALGALAFLAPAASAQTIKLGTLVPEGSVWDKALRSMGSEWKKDTGGRVSMRIYPGGVAGDEPALLRKIRIGQLHGGMISTSGLGEIDYSLRVFETPHFFQSDAEVRYILEKVGPTFEERLKEHDLVLLHWGHAGWLRIFSVEPIEKYGDFARMKHFVWGSETRMGTWLQEKGLKPVPLAATDVLTGLQTGLIETLPLTPLTGLSLQWFRSAPYMIENRFAPLLGATVLSKRAWNKIKPADRKALLSSARATQEFLFAEVPKSEERALAEMQRRGLTVHKMTDASDLLKWGGLAQHIEDRLREHTVPPEIFSEITTCVGDFRDGDAEGSD